MTKLTNSKNVQLYANPENIKKAQKKRKDKVFCTGLLKYTQPIYMFKRTRQSLIAA